MIPGVVSAFHTRGDEWFLKRKLDIMSMFSERIFIVLDRPTDETYRIIEHHERTWGNLYWESHKNTMGLPDEGPDGPICEEGRMRQRAWDLAATHRPTWIVLGDTDEIPTPEIIPFLRDGLADPDVDVYYADWVNLWQSDRWYIGGTRCIWSPHHPQSTKKGVVCRWRPAVEYRYDLRKTRHTRLEPNPVDASLAVRDKKHVLQMRFALLHYKWVNWAKWKATNQSGLKKYQRMFEGMELRPLPEAWMWGSNVL